MAINSQVISMDEQTKKNVDRWLSGNFDEQTKASIHELMKDNPTELINAFYTNLKFGTAGLRGIMGAGTNRMNTYTVRGATQGLANYLKRQKFPDSLSVLIGYDSRLNSQQFAEDAARVLASNGIRVFLNEQLRPVPLVSFGTRFKHCQAGIMITASHNPPEYNGYKVYWGDGAQVLPPHDVGIIKEVNSINNLDEIGIAPANDPLIIRMGPDVDEAYLQTIHGLQLYPNDNQEKGDLLKIVYTSIHGAGITMVPKALAMWGFINVDLVESQIEPNGKFPTVKVPNPEFREALKLGIETLVEKKGDILLATDPDTDRIGIALNHNNDVTILDGNQIIIICLEHICQALQAKNKFPQRPAFIKSIVTTELFKTICDHYNVPCFDVLTGFKYIGELITNWENEPDGYQYIFGGEESFGFLLGDYARDKDAVISSCLLSEVALQAKLKGKTLVDLLHEIYEKYGVFRSRLESISFPETKEGREKMGKALVSLRENPPSQILGNQVIAIEDYLNSTKVWVENGNREKIDLPQSNVLVYWLNDGSKIALRPSGTEPKVKIYAEVKSKPNSPVPLGIEHCDVIAFEYIKTLKNLLLS